MSSLWRWTSRDGKKTVDVAPGDSTPTATAVLRISTLANLGKVYARSADAELFGLETLLEIIEETSNEILGDPPASGFIKPRTP